MGKGNVCTFGRCEGLYFIDYDKMDWYRRLIDGEDVWESSLREDIPYEDIDKWEYDEIESDFERDFIKQRISELMIEKFKSFEYKNAWISRSRYALLENDLFYIVVEDNEWSLAIELIEKDVPEMVGFQMKLYKSYLKGLEEILLDMFDEIGTYNGAWTHGTLKKEVA